ncbi:AraC family transcriptional regulator [Yeosuana marina]|uniref:helix-turn-helix domain-containing protein n=1 Tax=Yeosuana marina TaxID=1565536 RepID=UPI0030EF5C28|tara:strand:+ start:886 stop:1965 length:1080 start_codon:yes stop_codon:yes gene_type:complete
MNFYTETLLVSILLLGFYLSKKLFVLSKNSKLIAFYTLTISLISLNQILSYYDQTVIIFPIFNSLTGFLLAPLLFFHTISLLNIKNLKSIIYKHFIASIPALCIIIYWIFDDYRRKLLGYNNNSYITALIALQFLVYMFLLIYFIKDNKLLIKAIKPTLQYRRIKFSITLFLIQFIITICLVVENYLIDDMSSQYLVFLIFGLLMTQLLMIFNEWKSNPLFFRENDNLTHITFKTKNDLGIIKNDSDNLILQDLKKLMSEQKIFKDSNLNLNGLSAKLNISEHTLSKILKDTFHLTYSQYISFQRLEEAKKLLEETHNNDLRINEIMYEVGFNSKSAFNTWFKKNTGFTPTAFKKGSQK